MRFSLALLLHQIEQTLQESFGQMLAEIVARDTKEPRGPGDGGEGEGGGGGGDPLSGEMESLVAHLTKQMRTNENNHKAEVEKNKVGINKTTLTKTATLFSVQETIAQLSSKMETLKIEVSKLRRVLPSDTTNREGMIMFTRLDSERNTKALETAMERERYGPSGKRGLLVAIGCV